MTVWQYYENRYSFRDLVKELDLELLMFFQDQLCTWVLDDRKDDPNLKIKSCTKQIFFFFHFVVHFSSFVF